LPCNVADVTATAKSGKVAMTLTPPFCGQPGRSMPSATVAQKQSQARAKRRRWKRRKVAHPLAAKRAEEKSMAVRPAHCRSCRMLPAPDTRNVICKAASCAGVRSAEPPAHESPPSPRVCRVRRPGSLKITSSCVRVGDGAVTLTAAHRPPVALGSRRVAVSAPACRHPSRPPLARRTGKSRGMNQILLDEMSQPRRTKNR